jgi:hypothetical protein
MISFIDEPPPAENGTRTANNSYAPEPVVAKPYIAFPIPQLDAESNRFNVQLEDGRVFTVAAPEGSSVGDTINAMIVDDANGDTSLILIPPDNNKPTQVHVTNTGMEGIEGSDMIYPHASYGEGEFGEQDEEEIDSTAYRPVRVGKKTMAAIAVGGVIGEDTTTTTTTTTVSTISTTTTITTTTTFTTAIVTTTAITTTVNNTHHSLYIIFCEVWAILFNCIVLLIAYDMVVLSYELLHLFLLILMIFNSLYIYISLSICICIYISGVLLAGPIGGVVVAGILLTGATVPKTTAYRHAKDDFKQSTIGNIRNVYTKYIY